DHLVQVFLSTHSMATKCINVASLVTCFLIAGGISACPRDGAPILHALNDSGPGIDTVASATGSSVSMSGLAPGTDGLHNPRCDCLTAHLAPPLGPDEAPVRGEVVSLDWGWQMNPPLCAEKLSCVGQHHP